MATKSFGSYFIIMALSLSAVHFLDASDVKEYCVHEFLNATCPRGHVVLMQHALYGRMNTGRCITGEGGYLGCSTDVLPLIDAECSGWKSCVVHVRNLIDVRPCRKDFTSYLEAGYTCVNIPGLTPSSARCRQEHRFPVPPAPGYLTSVPALTQVGSQACPWVIQVDNGQKINLTIFDFTLEPSSKTKDDSGSNRVNPPCPLQIVVEEAGVTESLGVCSMYKQRIRTLFTSKTSKLTAYIQDTGIYSSGKAPFLIRYEAMGCPDPAPTHTNAWVRRTDADTLVAKCNDTDETWYLTCHNTVWIGEIGNCTDRSLPERASDLTAYGSYVPHGIILAILIGIILGVLIGAVMLLAVHCYRRRMKRQHRRGGNELVGTKLKHGGGSTVCVKHCSDPNLLETYPALLMDVEQSTERHICPNHYPTAIHLTEKDYVQRLDIIDNGSTMFPAPPPKCANIDRKNMYELPKYGTHTFSKNVSVGGGGGGGGAVPSVYFELEHQHEQHNNKSGTVAGSPRGQQASLSAPNASENNENTG